MENTEDKAQKLINSIEVASQTQIANQLKAFLNENKVSLEGYMDITREQVIALANAYHKFPSMSTIRIKVDNIFLINTGV